jgi:hypothetical protein
LHNEIVEGIHLLNHVDGDTHVFNFFHIFNFMKFFCVHISKARHAYNHGYVKRLTICFEWDVVSKLNNHSILTLPMDNLMLKS